jgi:hypothetical protein
MGQYISSHFHFAIIFIVGAILGLKIISEGYENFKRISQGHKDTEISWRIGQFWKMISMIYLKDYC